MSSVPHTGACYNIAIKLLSDAFSDEVVQQFSVIQRIVDLKLNEDKDFHHWISEVRILMDQIEALDINGEIFAQYFVWKGLSGKYKESNGGLTNRNQVWRK